MCGIVVCGHTEVTSPQHVRGAIALKRRDLYAEECVEALAVR